MFNTTGQFKRQQLQNKQDNTAQELLASNTEPASRSR